MSNSTSWKFYSKSVYKFEIQKLWPFDTGIDMDASGTGGCWTIPY